MPTLTGKMRREVKRCRRSFKYFCKYLKVTDKGADPDDPALIGMSAAERTSRLAPKQVPFVMRYSQELIYDALEEHFLVGVLKPRQTYGSTIVAAYFTWKFVMQRHFKVAVVAHQKKPAQELLNKYREFFDSLPWWLKPKQVAGSADEICAEYGRVIKVGTMYGQGREAFRAYTYSAAHCSEAARYQEFEKSIAALLNTCIPSAQIAFETTADGMNSFQRWWVDKNGYHKLFIPWMDNKEYIRNEPPVRQRTDGSYTREYTPKEKSYFYGRKLNNKQKNWMAWCLRTRCHNDINYFNQEYPDTAEIAFIASGDAFFDARYDYQEISDGYIDFGAIGAPGKKPWLTYDKESDEWSPGKYRVFSMGVDTASGSKVGDYSTFCVLDVTDRKENKIYTVATGYFREGITRFTDRVYEEAKKWNALIVPEKNNHGMSVVDRLLTYAYPRLYSRVPFDQGNREFHDEFGWVTNARTKMVLLRRLQEYLNNGWIDPDVGQPRCPRLRAEVNTFVHHDNGNPGAQVGYHDDMVMAYGLALMGLDQIHHVHERIKKRRPINIAEMCAWEMAHGQRFDPSDDSFWDPLDDYRTAEPVEDALGVMLHIQ